VLKETNIHHFKIKTMAEIFYKEGGFYKYLSNGEIKEAVIFPGFEGGPEDLYNWFVSGKPVIVNLRGWSREDVQKDMLDGGLISAPSFTPAKKPALQSEYKPSCIYACDGQPYAGQSFKRFEIILNTQINKCFVYAYLAPGNFGVTEKIKMSGFYKVPVIRLSSGRVPGPQLKISRWTNSDGETEYGEAYSVSSPSSTFVFDDSETLELVEKPELPFKNF